MAIRVLNKNKDITDIRYNHLNLPDTIVVTGKGPIKYQYDAAGNKLKKTTIEGAKTTVTLYLAGTVYRNDTLEFIAHEEGRIRWKQENNTFNFDYFLKDHLGNVRMVLTEEQQTDAYPAASLETAQLTNEKLYYSRIDSGRVNKSTVAGYPTDPYTNPNDFITKVKAAAGSPKIGTAIVLKVMAGDKFNIRANSWYKLNGVTPGTPISPLNDLLAALTGSVGSITAAHNGTTTTQLTSSGVLTPGATSFLNSQTAGADKPKAYVNWVLFDEQFKLVSSNSGFEQVGIDQEFKTHLFNNKPIDKSGYLYVYVSNETPNIDVFFDNLQVTHIRGSLLEETHYYPFGLTMTGISSKALAFGNPENKLKYNGIEKENDLQIEIYDAQLRELDGQIGRWWQVDPETESMEMWSPYTSNYDNPITYMDPLGNEPDGCCGGLVKLIDEVLISASGVVNGTLNTMSFGAISSDPFNFRSKLNDEQRQTYDRGVTVGKTAPALMPFAPSRRPPSMELVPAGGSGKGGPVIVEAPPGKLGPVTTVQSNSNSSSGKGTQNSKVKEAIAEGNAQHADLRAKVKNKPGWKSEPVKTDQLTKKKLKPDVETPSGNLIELKPRTTSGIAKGKAQQQKYEKGTNQKTRVVYYTPK